MLFLHLKKILAVDYTLITTRKRSMSEAPKQSETIQIDKILTTEMTLESRTKNCNQPHQNHLQVSTEFLGGRFDAKG